MADDYFLSIIEEMDRLWFHQIILLSEPTAPVAHKPSQIPPSLPESFSCPASTLSLPILPDELTSSSTDVSPSPEIEASSESISVSLQDDSNNVEENKERPKRINLLDNRTRSHPPTPTAQNRPRKSRKARGLQKSMSCRTMGELEIEEVKGFMDLGFIFRQENISPRMMNLVPGLHRLGINITQTKQKQNPRVMDEQLEQEKEQRDITRPYLSEAWLIERPDSPLLNLKIPKLCSSAHMKKHLRFWARTVASEIHLNEYHATNQF
ncbi:hypothetical protein L6164_033650 [Bauhinia variegata]|uniref:Uncharacterized protein n=1 Tax=Bauhinia variegata TaxID=167791 RepID=A0ACB9KT67_BAUVA|nr:hypothetical protein L6164_033650 [Bauhinia variegata]